MMRLLILAGLALCAACAPQQTPHCEARISREIAFTESAAPDVIAAQTLGEYCAQAFGVLTITTHEGDPVWVYAAPLARAFGEGFAEPEEEAMNAFLERWAQAELSRTSAAPAWTQLSAGQTGLDQLTYEDIRARDLPMLCHYAGTGRQLCVFWEPAAGGAGQLLDLESNEEGQTP
ncbi:MAG TPA: hypothetical protein PKY87_00660 [Terricaulis sp.]|nr:hypothetical protein [Terricaulis sp.]